MPPKRVVLDSNVFISGFVFRGRPAQLLQQAEDAEFSLLTSGPIRLEVERVLTEKFKWPEEVVAAICGPLWAVSQKIEPLVSIAECSDPDDNRILECAVAGQADYIVSGDHHLLDMQEFAGISILRINEFMDKNLTD